MGVQGGYSRDANGADRKEQDGWCGDRVPAAQLHGVADQRAGLLIVDDGESEEWETVG